MIKRILLASAFIGSASLLEAMAESYQLENNFIFLRGSAGSFDQLHLDPHGTANFGDNLITHLGIGEPMKYPRSFQLERSTNQLLFRELTVYLPKLLKQEEIGYPREIHQGESAGVAFETDFSFHRLEACMPTWQTHNSSVQLALYVLDRLPADGEEVRPDEPPLAQTTLENVRDNGWAAIELGPIPAGIYYLEARRGAGRVGWWGKESANGRSSGDSGIASKTVSVEDGRAREDLRFTLRVHGAETRQGTWSVSLQGRELVSRFFPSAKARAEERDWETRLVMAWDNSGYDLDFFPFERFYSSIGQHIFPQQLKRRPYSDQVRASRWFRAVGREAADLLLEFNSLQEFEGPPPFRWQMEPDALHWIFADTELSLRAEPKADRLPEIFPRFVASDEAYANELTDFYLGHGLNWGANTAGDWKEWDGMRLSWTANPTAAHHAWQLLHRPMSANGYVWTWGGGKKSYQDQIGWPFPFRDDDGDGLNDRDTRHFTTNAVLISASARHALWSRDRDFIRRALPRARLAMEYQLSQLQGRDGIIITNAEERDGVNGNHGSNYWDILPFGHKDAYSNIYYYNSLLQMAELETVARELLQESDFSGPGGPEPRAPAWYRGHAAKVKRIYSDEFWDDAAGRFIGCIDIHGNPHDYGFTFLNLEAMAYGLATPGQVERIYHWMENEPTSSGEADTYTRWGFAPRATTLHNPPPDGPQEPLPTWRYSGWGWGDWEVQCQDGGAILYTSAFDLIARSRYLGADNADRRLREIVERWSKPDRLMGGSPLYFGEITQGGPGGTAGSVGVEGEFPESGLVPATFLYTVIGAEARPDGLHLRPALPASLDFAGVENLRYDGRLWNVTVTSAEVIVTDLNEEEVFRQRIHRDDPAIFRPWEQF